MPVLSLNERLDLLEKDLLAKPQRISVYSDLPFAIVRYDPSDEWELRRQANLLAVRLKQAGKTVTEVSLADLLWEAITQTEGIEAVIELEQQRGFETAQEQVTTYLSDPDWLPLPDALAQRLQGLDAKTETAFVIHAAVMAPALYHMSKLLDELQGRVQVPTVLFYPGALDGITGLRFMALQDREALGNYRVKIYG